MAETLEGLVGRKPQADIGAVRIGLVGFTLAQEVYHPFEPWCIKEANQFMASHMRLHSQQDTQLNSDLKRENCLAVFEKLPTFQPLY